jgi:segregation and condensation protein A
VFVPFTSFFKVEEGRMGVVVTFLAILELIKEGMLDVVQSEPFAPIHIKAAGSSAEKGDDDEGAEPEPQGQD